MVVVQRSKIKALPNFIFTRRSARLKVLDIFFFCKFLFHFLVQTSKIKKLQNGNDTKHKNNAFKATLKGVLMFILEEDF